MTVPLNHKHPCTLLQSSMKHFIILSFRKLLFGTNTIGHIQDCIL